MFTRAHLYTLSGVVRSAEGFVGAWEIHTPTLAAYRLRTYRHKAYYSLDRNDGIEHEALFVALSPHELYERKVNMQELHAAISRLPDKQAKRIYAHFILGMTKKDIARAEGVHEKVVRVAIERGLRSLEKILKKVL